MLKSKFTFGVLTDGMPNSPKEEVESQNNNNIVLTNKKGGYNVQ